MSRDRHEHDERLLDLLVDRATNGLDREEAWDLAHRLAANPVEGGHEFSTIDAVVAELDIEAGEIAVEPMPEALRQRILADAPRHAIGVARDLPAEPALAPLAARPTWMPWAVAAAALFAAVWGWWPSAPGAPGVEPEAQVAVVTPAETGGSPSTPPRSDAGTAEATTAEIDIAAAPRTAGAAPAPDEKLATGSAAPRTDAPRAIVQAPRRPRSRSAADELAAFLAEARDVHREPWQRTMDVAALTANGEVVWSDERQEGFMRFEGLPPNNPGSYQYQLWIFDGERDERYPVDGGVFDIAVHGKETIVPIRATLPVKRAQMFAVTLEAPGGVVVSSRERLLLLAKVP